VTFLEAAKTVLLEVGHSLGATEITRRAIERGLLETRGKTPAQTMYTQLLYVWQRGGAKAPVVRLEGGKWGLAGHIRGQDCDRPQGDGRGRWFLTTNPSIYDAQVLLAKDREKWGRYLRSPLTQKRLREEVQVGDTALVYRSKPLADVICEVEVVRGPQLEEGRHLIEVSPVRSFDPPIPLAALRSRPELRGMEFLRNPQVSVSRLTDDQYEVIVALVVDAVAPDAHTHDSIMWQLIALGMAFRCDVWVAPDSRGHSYADRAFADHCLAELPNLGFSQETVDLVRGIDVLWLRGNSILSAFEIEHTTAIYSGILRLSDLIALQPNINIDLYVVASGGRRAQVARQLGRPTFKRLPRPLGGLCQFIAYEQLSDLARKVEAVAGYVDVELVRTVAEDCE
jgi:predicted RNA-binding protein with PUA-like domain